MSDSIRISLAKGVDLELSDRQAQTLLQQLTAALGARNIAGDEGGLADDHPVWLRHSGPIEGWPEWAAPDDLALAQAFYSEVRGKAAVLLDYLIDHPGRQIDAEELVAASPEFSSINSVAGALNGMRIPRERAGRRYPFYWWAGTPSKYGMKSSVAALFAQARKALR